MPTHATLTGGLVPISKIATGTPTGTKFVRDDGVLAVPAGSGSTTTTETTINFGTKPVYDKSFTITDAGVTGSSKILIFPSGNAPSGRHSDDWQWDSITFAAVAGSGQFTLYANANGPVEGTRNIYYQ